MAHVHEKIDFTVNVLVVHKGRILLRMHEKYGTWLGLGGHIELHEDPVEAAVREAREEAGLDIHIWAGERKFESCGGEYEQVELPPPFALNRHRISPTHEHVGLEYLATCDSDVIKPSAGEAKTQFCWATEADLITLEMLPDLRAYAKFALDTLGEK